MKFVFLALALAPLLLPLIFQVNKKIYSNGSFKPAVGAALISAIIFSVIAVLQHWFQVTSYKTGLNLGISIKEVPVELYILNFSFAFAALSIYQYLNVKFPNNNLQRYSLALSNLLLGLCVAFLFFAYTKWYTLFTFATLLVVLFLIEYVGKLRFMYKAYRAFLVSLVPFYVVYGIVFWSELFVVAPSQLSGMHIAKIPIETHFVVLAMLLLAIYMFEFFKSKKAV
ncbi:lycopene cyclase domain-containing protein [Pedobacter sp.]